jgi:hypothetical protein
MVQYHIDNFEQHFEMFSKQHHSIDYHYLMVRLMLNDRLLNRPVVMNISLK